MVTYIIIHLHQGSFSSPPFSRPLSRLRHRFLQQTPKTPHRIDPIPSACHMLWLSSATWTQLLRARHVDKVVADLSRGQRGIARSIAVSASVKETPIVSSTEVLRQGLASANGLLNHLHVWVQSVLMRPQSLKQGLQSLHKQMLSMLLERH